MTIIVKQAGPVSFRIRLEDVRLVRRHVDYVRRRRVDDDKEESSVPEKKCLLNCLRQNLFMCIREDLQPYDVQTQPSDEDQGPPCEPH